MNEVCIWQYIFLGGVEEEGGGLKWCWHNIRRGGYLNDDAWLQRGDGGVKNLGKSDYIISECS